MRTQYIHPWFLAAVVLLGLGTFAQAQDRGWSPRRGGSTSPIVSGVLIRNPDQDPGAAPYALTDFDGRVRRLVEPNDGIDLESMLGRRVRVRHDTGRTLLATQLEMPELQPLAGFEESNFDSRVRPAQDYAYVDAGEGMPPIVVEPCGPDGMGYPEACDVPCEPPMQVPCAPVAPCPSRCARCSPRSFVFGEYLFLRSTDADVTHAQQQNGIGGAGTVPFGKIGSVYAGYSSGFRVGGGLWVDECSSITAAYTWYETDGSDTVTPPTIPGGGGAVGSLVHDPGASITASVGPVTANHDISFRLAEVLYRDALKCCDWMELNYSAGGIYSELEQTFDQTGTFAGGSAGRIDTASSLRFQGGGLKVGLDGRRRLFDGFNIYGRASAAAMTGRETATYSMTNFSTATTLSRAEWKDNRAVSLFEYELGVGWSTPQERLSISAGYLFQRWGNIVATDEWIAGVRQDSYVDLQNSLGFDGLTARAEARW